jgi:vacuolar-type H+-ATPase subunit C/Vma6
MISIEENKNEAYVHFRLPKSLFEDFKTVIEAKDGTASKVMRRLLSEYVKANKKAIAKSDLKGSYD